MGDLEEGAADLGKIAVDVILTQKEGQSTRVCILSFQKGQQHEAFENRLNLQSWAGLGLDAQNLNVKVKWEEI